MSVDPRDRCRCCRRPLRDRESKYRRVGPNCWEELTPEEQAAALRLAVEERRPGYVPPMRPPSWVARRNAAGVGQVVLEATEPDEKRCTHGYLATSCPECKREADVRYALRVKTTVDRILDIIRAQPREQRTAERVRVVSARIARGFPEYFTRPRRAPAPKPSAPPPAPATQQLELL